MKKVAVAVLLAALFGAIIGIFWHQELQYALPTPVPANYQVVLPDEIIRFDSALISQQHDRPKLLHFFSPDCPCSRFNLAHFESLIKTYGKEIDFYVVIEDEALVEAAKRKIQPDVTIVVDRTQALAKACGVYSTPQAALIRTNNKLYFRGNFNRSRYCTDPNSNFVQMALDSLLSNKAAPFFSELATISYGCEIGTLENSTQPVIQ